MLLSFTVLVSVFDVCCLPFSVTDLCSSGSVEFHWGTLGIVGIPARVHVWVSSWHHAFPQSSGLISPQALTHWGFLHILPLFRQDWLSCKHSSEHYFPFSCSQMDTHDLHGWLHAHAGCGRNWEPSSLSAVLLSPSLFEKKIIARVISNYSPSLFSLVSVGTRSVLGTGAPLPCPPSGISPHTRARAVNHRERYVLLLLINPHCLPQRLSLILSTARIKRCCACELCNIIWRKSEIGYF